MGGIMLNHSLKCLWLNYMPIMLTIARQMTIIDCVGESEVERGIKIMSSPLFWDSQ